MLPKKPCDSLTCLQELIGIRSECTNGNCYPFYIEDIEGFNIKKLAEIANVNSPNAVMLAKDIINSGSKEMLGDIELLLNDGFHLRETFGDYCANSDFKTIYVAGGGTRVTSTLLSSYSILRITKINALTNFTGAAMMIIHDGKEAKTYNVNLQAGVVSPIVLNYFTEEKTAKIYFSDNTIGVAQLVPTTTGGCGCGTTNAVAEGTVKYTGIVNNIETVSQQYGFQVCASVSCDSNLLTCDIVKKTPNIFGLTLSYKIGYKFYSQSYLADRNNRTAGFDDEKKITMQDFYNTLYQQRLRGTRTMRGISSLIGNYLSQRRDKCVECTNTVRTGWAVG